MAVLPATIWHRTTESFELEATLKGHLVPRPCKEQGHLPPDEVALSLVQPDLKRLSGQPPPLWARRSGASPPSCQNFFRTSNLNPPSFPLKLFPLALPQGTLLRTPESSGLNAAGKCAVSRHHGQQKGLAEHCITPVSALSAQVSEAGCTQTTAQDIPQGLRRSPW